jgi:hypothetical protein
MEATVFLIMGAIGIAIGTVSALAAEKFPVHQTLMERWGGDLLVGGIALLGFGFPMV